MLQRIFLFFLFLMGNFAFAVENVNFISKPLTAGKASLTENGFLYTRTLGIANFSPELRYPIQLVYNSAREKTGAFGFAWSSPQLESSAYYDKDGVLWTTPWGEKIKFFPKKGKMPKDAIKIELYEAAKKGRGFYAPYSEWEANTSASDKKVRQSGNWIFTGKRNYQGWKFVYKDGRLQRISSSAGRSITFNYNKGKLISISQDDCVFVELNYENSQVSELKINGVVHKIAYETLPLTILPKEIGAAEVKTTRPGLVSIQTGDLNPFEFSYDDYGFLAKIRQGEFVESLQVQHQKQEERQQELQAKKDRKVKYSGAINGRLLSDLQFNYSYPDREPGKVRLTNRLRQHASYDFAENTGVFKITEFSGKSYTVYYFMRMDVAYLGKVRKIVDARGRDVVNYRYDKLTGNVIRVRDMADNDINFEYNTDGNLKLITRRAADQTEPEPVTAFSYGRAPYPTEIFRLNADGKPAVATQIHYNQNNQPVSVSNGQTQAFIQYNSFGYPVAVTNSFDQTVKREFDAFNRQKTTTDIYGVQTTCYYTLAGLISKIERKDGAELLNSIEITYNGNGQPVSYRDQAGRVKKFERDAFGRVIKELFPDETSVEYSYNAVGQLHKVLDQNRHTITFDWNRFGLDSRRTGVGQLTDYVHDKYGMLSRMDSKWKGKTDRSIKYEYDKLDRLVKITYADNQVETFSYNSWGKLIASTRGDRKATFQYDYFGRLIRKTDGDAETTYRYNRYGQRIERILKNGTLILAETKTYDKFGRLIEIKSGGKEVKYIYNDKNQLMMQIVDGCPIYFEYTKYGQLKSKILGGKASPVSMLKYIYSPDGTIIGRVVDDKYQMYLYDRRGQLLQVSDMQGNVAERYVYDPAGNILSKTVNGKTTSYAYDKANQLVSSTCDGKTTHYEYDAAGRMVKEGDKTYTYGYLDKILAVQLDGQQTAAFDYHMDGQLARVVRGDKSEEFSWDGLALIHRGGTNYINEPYVTGGNPILANDKLLFNDMLGTTLGVKTDKCAPIQRDAFGMATQESHENFFTGKPYIGELGYAFLLRNYRADQGKWLTQDPLGYPDGWNNFAYCNNYIISCLDLYGAWKLNFIGFSDKQQKAFEQYFNKIKSSLQQRINELNQYLNTAGGCVGCPSGCKCSEATASNYLGMTRVKEILDNMLTGINNSKTMNIRVGDFGDSVHAAITVPVGNQSPNLRLNINEKYNFFANTQGALKTLFHELSHLGGSEDEYGPAWWLDAATLENLAVSSVHKVYRKYMDCICE